MDTKDLKGLMEAYSEVYAPQEIDEAVKGASRHDTEMRKADSAERRAGVKNRLSPSKGRQNADKMQRDINYFDKVTKKTKPSVVGMTQEQVDIFDVVLEFLQAEGYAETLEEAEWLMANVINEEAIDIILSEAQHARENPEKYEREQAKKTSKREKAMNDPHTGINSPAFAEFMRKQMGR